MTIPLSVLDLVPVRTGSTGADALREIVDLAALAERLGYVRLWFAEHHGMPSIASSSPEVLIAHLAVRTERIRVGSGGIMLPNHVPLRVAEVFHTLEALHPGRIDLGIGRAPGSDQATAQAMRPFDAEQFPQQLAELMALSRRSLPADHPFATVRVAPDGVALPPIWLLGSSGASASFAGSLGLGYAFARHFSVVPAEPALRAYRGAFVPSPQFAQPHVIVCIAAICAETDEEADYLARSTDLMWVRFRRNEYAPIPSPEEASAYVYSDHERPIVDANRARHFIGRPDRVVAALAELARSTSADEIMVTTMLFDHEKRLRSYELLAQAWQGHNAA